MDELLNARYDKFRRLGNFAEGPLTLRPTAAV
jgi:hypothetical protein